MEKRVAMEFLDASLTGSSDPSVDRERWSHFAHVLINTKEFLFLR
jgi:hypothetical protein